MRSPCGIVDPDLCPRRDLTVVLRVDGFARTGHARHLVGGATYRQIIANQAKQITLALDHMHRDDRFREPAILLFRTKMQLADRNDLMSCISEPMMPALDGPII